MTRPGRVRIISASSDNDYAIAGLDVHIQVMQANGEWIDIPVTTRATIEIVPDQLVTLTLDVLPQDIELLNVDGIALRIIDPPLAEDPL